VILGVAGSDTPFVFIWDEDVVACLERGIHEDRSGIYNLAGDGVISATRLCWSKGIGGLRWLHETSFVVQRVRNPPGHG